MGGIQSMLSRKGSLTPEEIKEKFDKIATEFIFLQNRADSASLIDQQQCEEYVILTTNLIKKIKPRKLKIVDRDTHHVKTVESYVGTPAFFAELMDKHSAATKGDANRQQICESLARFYVMIAHLFASIRVAIQPVYEGEIDYLELNGMWGDEDDDEPKESFVPSFEQEDSSEEVEEEEEPLNIDLTSSSPQIIEEEAEAEAEEIPETFDIPQEEEEEKIDSITEVAQIEPDEKMINVRRGGGGELKINENLLNDEKEEDLQQISTEQMPQEINSEQSPTEQMQESDFDDENGIDTENMSALTPLPYQENPQQQQVNPLPGFLTMDENKIPHYKIKHYTLCRELYNDLVHKPKMIGDNGDDNDNDDGTNKKINIRPGFCEVDPNSKQVSSKLNQTTLKLNIEQNFPKLQTLFMTEFNPETMQYELDEAAYNEKISRIRQLFNEIYLVEDSDPAASGNTVRATYMDPTKCTEENVKLMETALEEGMKKKQGWMSTSSVENTYIEHLATMKKNIEKAEEKIAGILEKIFTFDREDNKYTIHPDLNEVSIVDVMKETRELISGMYIQCEEDYLEALKLYEALIDDTLLEQLIRKEQEIGIE